MPTPDLIEYECCEFCGCDTLEVHLFKGSCDRYQQIEPDYSEVQGCTNDDCPNELLYCNCPEAEPLTPCQNGFYECQCGQVWHYSKRHGLNEYGERKEVT